MWSVIKAVNIYSWSPKGKLDYVDDWFLMSSPVPILTIWLTYLAFVLKVGPTLMKGRSPFKLTKVLIVYNIIQVIISVVLTIRGFRTFKKHGLLRSECLSDTPETEQMLVIGFYHYFLVKISELIETVFFVLRKKYNQISFLHLYHHSLMLVCTWFVIKFEPSPSIHSIGTFNSLVHVVMYTYYTLAAFPKLKKYLWWKSLLTQLQLIQFLAIFICVSLDYHYSSCKPSFILFGVILVNAVLMIVLFSNFYIKSYRAKNESKMVDNNSNMNHVIGAKSKTTGKLKNDSEDIFSNGSVTKENRPISNGMHKETDCFKREVKSYAQLSNGSSRRKRYL